MATKKSSAKKYGKKTEKTVERVMHEKKHGTLRSGLSGKKVTSRKQAIAIGLSEARAAGAKVPKKSTAKKATAKKAKRTTAKKTGAKRTSAKRATKRAKKK